MSVNPLLTNYNAVGGGLFAPASGGGGGGGSVGPNIVASTITLGGISNNLGSSLNLLTGPSNALAEVNIRDSSNIFNILTIAGGINIATSLYDVTITQDLGQQNSGILNINGFSTINALTQNLNISSINGAIPAGGGPLLSTFGNMTAESLRLSTGSVTGLSGIELIYFGQNSVGNQGFGIVDPATNTKVALIGSEFNPTSAKFDTYISCAGPGSASSGRIEFVNQTFLNAPNANLAISTINGAVPGGGSGATSIALPINTLPTNLADFATTISPATAVAVSANPLITITSLPIGWYSISIPRFVVCPAQSTPGTPAPGTTVPYGTFVNYFLRVGTGATTSDNPLIMVPIVPEGTGVVSSTQSETHLYGTFYNPVATPFDTFTLYTYATTPTGTTGIGNWCQVLSSVGGIASYAIITPLPT